MTPRAGFVALIGEPNAGKSTLLNRMVGAKVSIVTHKVQTTRARIRGIAIEGAAQIVFVDTPGIFRPRRRLDRSMVKAAWGGASDARLGIGYLPQEVSIFRGLSVEDNILAVLEIAVGDRHKRRERLEELLSEFSITHLRRTPALALSGGERRRVEIARCLAADPKYLLLDEPFAGVDPIAVGEIRHLVQALKARGIGVLITDHNVRETLEIVDRAYILHDGKVLMSGTTDEVVRDETVRRVYLGENFRII